MNKKELKDFIREKLNFYGHYHKDTITEDDLEILTDALILERDKFIEDLLLGKITLYKESTSSESFCGNFKANWCSFKKGRSCEREEGCPYKIKEGLNFLYFINGCLAKK